MAEAGRDLLHRIESRTHRSPTPFVKELARPSRAAVIPKPLKVLPQETHRTERRLYFINSSSFTVC